MVCKEELAAYHSWTKKGKIDIHAFMQKGSRINQVYVNNCNTSVLVPYSGNLPRLIMHDLFPSLNPLWWLWLMCIRCPKETRNGKLKVKYIRTDWRNNLWKNIALYSGIPIFSNPRFFKLPDFSNHGTFPLDLLQSNTVILPLIFRTLDFSKLLIFRSNSYLPWKKFIWNLPSMSGTLMKLLKYYSVACIWMVTHLRLKTWSHLLLHSKQYQGKYCSECLSFEWSLIRPGFHVGAAYYVYTVVLTFESWVKS